MGLLTGKTALITGAARGIGKAIALKFAEEGANIAFTDLKIDENGEETRKEIEAKGVKCMAYASNAANFEETAEVVNKIKEDFGSIDILVNNAGITKDGLMLRMTEQQWDAVIAVNLKSAFNFIHAYKTARSRAYKRTSHYESGEYPCKLAMLFTLRSIFGNNNFGGFRIDSAFNNGFTEFHIGSFGAHFFFIVHHQYYNGSA